jgi:hypothetical protein
MSLLFPNLKSLDQAMEQKKRRTGQVRHFFMVLFAG